MARARINLLATESNLVDAIDADTGAEVWKSSLGDTVRLTNLEGKPGPIFRGAHKDD